MNRTSDGIWTQWELANMLRQEIENQNEMGEFDMDDDSIDDIYDDAVSGADLITKYNELGYNGFQGWICDIAVNGLTQAHHTQQQNQ